MSFVSPLERAQELTWAGGNSGKDKDDVHARAYIQFRTPEALVAFHRGYDGHSFRDKQGQYRERGLPRATADPCADHQVSSARS